jgi:hypothetical protein
MPCVSAFRVGWVISKPAERCDLTCTFFEITFAACPPTETVSGNACAYDLLTIPSEDLMPKCSTVAMELASNLPQRGLLRGWGQTTSPALCSSRRDDQNVRAQRRGHNARSQLEVHPPQRDGVRRTILVSFYLRVRRTGQKGSRKELSTDQCDARFQQLQNAPIQRRCAPEPAEFPSYIRTSGATAPVQ